MRLDPKTTALLVIDLQNDTVGEEGAFAESGAAAFAREHGVVEQAARLADAFRAAGAQVIHVWHVDEPGHVDSTRNAELYRSIADVDALVRGTWGAEPVVAPAPGDVIVEKQRMSSFNSTTLDTKLRGLGATTVVCCGAWTNWAVEHTCRDAADHGYEVVVVTDATATISEEFQRAALDYALTTVATRATADLPLVELESDAGATFAVENPATGETVAEVPRMGTAETRRALERAEAALPAWSGMLAKERARILRRWADLMIEHEDELARLLTTEQGKPLAESRVEVEYAASFFEWFGEEAKRVYGDTIPTYALDRRIVVTKSPVGVTAGITPWNFPAAMPTRKSAPALAAGCTIVLKPAEQTPLTAMAIAQLGLEAGLPDGVFQLVTGNAEDAPTIGAELTGNPIVRKLGFTGSTEVGKLLMAQCAKHVTKVSLELGGNAPFIVFDDADLDDAVAGALICKFRNSGQTCISANRIYVQEGVYDEFVSRLVAAASKLKVGSGLDPETNVGPLIEQAAVDKVQRHVGDAVERGGEVLLGGEGLGGLFWQPTVITGVTAEAAMSCEETFGPVAGIARFATEAEAIREANDTPYGLAAYYYTRDNARIWRLSEALEYGIHGINTGLISSEVVPFGGMKESGIGREGSKYGIEEWLEIKYLCIGGVA